MSVPHRFAQLTSSFVRTNNMRMRGFAKISTCPEQRMAREMMLEKEKEVEKQDNDQATDNLNSHLFPGWKRLVGLEETTSRQLCRLELANKK